MMSGGGRFSQRSSVSITTSGWTWSRVAKLMRLSHISMIMTMTGLIYSIVQVHTHTHTHKKVFHACRATYTAKNGMLVILSSVLNNQA